MHIVYAIHTTGLYIPHIVLPKVYYWIVLVALFQCDLQRYLVRVLVTGGGSTQPGWRQTDYESFNYDEFKFYGLISLTKRIAPFAIPLRAIPLNPWHFTAIVVPDSWSSYSPRNPDFPSDLSIYTDPVYIPVASSKSSLTHVLPLPGKLAKSRISNSCSCPIRTRLSHSEINHHTVSIHLPVFFSQIIRLHGGNLAKVIFRSKMIWPKWNWKRLSMHCEKYSSGVSIYHTHNYVSTWKWRIQLTFGLFYFSESIFSLLICDQESYKGHQ